jgi:hypothetical protein
MIEEVPSEDDNNCVKGLSHRAFLGDSYALDVANTDAGSWGIDKVACFVPLDANFTNVDYGDWQKFTRQNGSNPVYEYFYKNVYCSQFPDLKARMEIRSHGSEMRLEFNPSRLLTSSYDLGTLDSVPKIVQLLTYEVQDSAKPEFSIDYETGEFLSPNHWSPNWMRQVRVSRCDVAYDFIPTTPLWNLKNLSNRATPMYGKKAKYHFGKGGVETITIDYAKSNGRVQVYDKHAEDPTSPVGLHRFEVQAHHDMLEDVHAVNLAGLTDSHILSLLKRRLKFSGFDVSLGDDDSRLSIINSLPVSPNQRLKYAGFIAMTDVGLDFGLDKRAYRKIQKEVGRFF